MRKLPLAAECKERDWLLAPPGWMYMWNGQPVARIPTIPGESFSVAMEYRGMEQPFMCWPDE